MRDTDRFTDLLFGEAMDGRIAYFTYGDPDLEAWGLRLLNQVSRALREAFPDPPHGDHVPLGPHFDYSWAPYLFLGRHGGGPLHIAWDTNLLIDYFQHGRSLWDRENDIESSYGDELEALQMLIALWVIRDIRFYVLREVLRDAKRRLTAQRQADRLRAFQQFASALMLVQSGERDIDEPSRAGLLILPDSELVRALDAVPEGGDRQLVHDAVRRGMNVFLTRDEGVLKAAPRLAPFGLLIASPGDLLEMLVGCGAFHCIWAPGYAYWPLPDQARVTHLIRALPSS